MWNGHAFAQPRAAEALSGHQRVKQSILGDAVTSEEGGVYVVKAGKEYDELGVSMLGETCMASPAVADGVLYFRTRGHLLAIGAK